VPVTLGSLDHYLCYTTSVTTGVPTSLQFAQRPKAAWLQNQFSSLLGVLGGFQKHCNPVQKTIPNGSVTGITKPNDHLACWSFTPNSNTPPPTAQVTNQFSPKDAAGNLLPVTLKIGALKSLCLPSLKSLDAANLPSGAPTDLDHYSCYAASYPTATPPAKPVTFVPPNPPKQSGVQLNDQFTDLASPPQTLTVSISTPQQLCLPTIKILSPDPLTAPPTIANLLDGSDYLVCFGLRVLSPVPFVPPAPVFDSNQFGVGQLTVKAASQLCVPSTSPSGTVLTAASGSSQLRTAQLVSDRSSTKTGGIPTLVFIAALCGGISLFVLRRRRLGARGHEMH
jgi:hypothetical protein